MVRVIFTSDFHLNEKVLKETLRIAERKEVDVFVNTGDFLSNNFANALAEGIEALGIKGLFVEGNWDNSLKINSHAVVVLKHNIVEIEGFYFFGTYEKIFLTHDDYLEFTSHIDGKKLVFLTHEPPYGVLDKVKWNGKHVGNREYMLFNEKKKPLIHAFGHIHESNGIEKKGGTLYINAAMADIPRCYVVDLNTLEVEKCNIKI